MYIDITMLITIFFAGWAAIATSQAFKYKDLYEELNKALRKNLHEMADLVDDIFTQNAAKGAQSSQDIIDRHIPTDENTTEGSA